LIRSAKDYAKRHWPALRLRTLLFLTLLFVAALPGVGAVFLRVYENTLVQQTEAELIAQGAVLAGAYRAAWPEAFADPPPGPLQPERPTIDLNAMPILGEQPEARPAGPIGPPRGAVCGRASPGRGRHHPIDPRAIRLMDARGTVVLGRGDAGLSYAHLPEVRRAMAGGPGPCFAAAATTSRATRSNG
jgi:two-component system sensor histidine kinase ChvG